MPNPGNANLPIGFFNPANQEIGDPRGKMRKRTTVVMAFLTRPIRRLAIPGGKCGKEQPL